MKPAPWVRVHVVLQVDLMGAQQRVAMMLRPGWLVSFWPGRIEAVLKRFNP